MLVVDQTKPNTFFFNIPSKPNLEDMELSEEQMEMVAGGDFWGAAWEIIRGPYTLATEGMDRYVDRVAAQL